MSSTQSLDRHSPEASGDSQGAMIDVVGSSAWNSDVRQRTIDLAPRPNLSTRPCTHCGLSMAVAPETPIEQPVFCCPGCHGAYELIHGWGLSDFYALRDSMSVTGAAQSAGQQSSYEQFDSADFLGPSAPRLMADGSFSTELGVQGLHCAACSWLIERALSAQGGIKACRVKMSDHTIRLHYVPESISLSTIAKLLDRLGYRLIPLDRSREKHLQLENRRLLMQIAVAGFLAANAMWIAVALYAGQFSGLAADHKYFFGWVGIVLGTTAVIGPGRTFFVGAWAALRTRTPHMDMPIALGLSAGTIVGLWHAITGSGPIYFDCLATLVFLLLIGRWIQFRQQHRAARSVELMLRITPRHADLIGPSGTTTTVLVDRLIPGDQIRIGAGQQVAADGHIVSGSSRLNRSLLTGESQPVAVNPGDKVEAGTVNVGSPIVVQVSAVGQASRIGQVMQSVEIAAAQRTPIVQLADRVGGVFVVVVMLLAAVTFLRWLPSGVHDATNYATALLIVACPCALALATPLAIAVGIGRAARSQILIRDGLSLQLLSKPGMLWFDKTGTLTDGRQQATLVWGSPQSLLLAAKIEEQCQHPIAQAIVQAAELGQAGWQNQTDGMHHASPHLPEATGVEMTDGGIAGWIGRECIRIGNAKYLQSVGIHWNDQLQRLSDQLLAEGETPIFIAVDSEVRGVLGLSDPVRPLAAEVIQRARRLGWQVGMLSGDHPEIARRVGMAVGIAEEYCFGGVSPEEKLEAIQNSRGRYPTIVMVGDGANDAAALAAADVGIAVRGGAEVSLHAAPIFMSSNRLMNLVRLLNGSITTTRVIALNFAVSFAYNLATVYSAWVGWISPLMAAILMPLSSATVLGLTFVIPSFTGKGMESELESVIDGGGVKP